MRSDRTPVRINPRLLLVAIAFHAPGLWLFFRRKLPATVRRENIAAGLVTLVSIAAVAWFSDNWIWVVVIWLLCHLSWGARFAWLLDRQRLESS